MDFPDDRIRRMAQGAFGLLRVTGAGIRLDQDTANNARKAG
jgi:hypothetical protein